VFACAFYASDVIVRGNQAGRLAFATLIALVALTLVWEIMPPLLDIGRPFYFLVFAVLFVAFAKMKRAARSVVQILNVMNSSIFGRFRSTCGRIVLPVLIIFMVTLAGAYQLSQIPVLETSDQVQVVGFLNGHATAQDMIAANSAIDWLLVAHAVDYAEVAFYTTHEPTYLYSLEQLSRFRMNISLWNCKYIVLDTPWLRDELGGSKSVELLTPIILQTWTRVYAIGDYRVYENPNPTAYPVANNYGVRSTFSLSEHAPSVIKSLPISVHNCFFIPSCSIDNMTFRVT
jgi:hypothetical protein